MPAPVSRVGQLDNDKIVEMSGGNRFNLVIMAAAVVVKSVVKTKIVKNLNTCIVMSVLC